ncbi:response regulator transcription factor [Aestuariibacter halophilus]|uniref:Response regulator transcription factor n=1 Tax=Fluctibacter halophilus TaxID=226011 RepID=A0ABS8G9H0_9ALTE|nr:response regulator transcription factor [Aestuariibacter halophilus]MCC2617089.1 response regulator transcription factor [Aestuariibacter halophilus]
MRILLVEDDRALADALSASLRSEGYAIDWVDNGKYALSAIDAGDAQLVILDLGLPDMDGLDVLNRVRHKNNNIPILVLTARDTLSDKISGLDSGADDYLPKPFDMTELLARLRVMERRLGTSNRTTIDVGAVSLDAANHAVTVDGQGLTLSRREFMLLKALMENVGRIRSKQQLETTLYEWGDEVASNAIEVHIHNLRKKLPDGFIKTIRGVGYSINKPVSS